MIKKIEDLNYYELLEISPSATSQEIHKAYERIRRVYEPNSVALYSLFTPDEIASLYQRIEEAYRTLVYEDNRRRYDLMLQGRNELPESPMPPPPPRYQPQPVQVQPRSEQSDREARQPTPVKPPQEAVSPVSQLITEFTGPTIKVLREQKGLTLRNIADMTKLGVRYLEYLEEETFQKLPARTYIRGFIMLYAKALGFDPERMAGDYLKRYDATISQKPK